MRLRQTKFRAAPYAVLSFATAVLGRDVIPSCFFYGVYVRRPCFFGCAIEPYVNCSSSVLYRHLVTVSALVVVVTASGCVPRILSAVSESKVACGVVLSVSVAVLYLLVSWILTCYEQPCHTMAKQSPVFVGEL